VAGAVGLTNTGQRFGVTFGGQLIVPTLCGAFGAQHCDWTGGDAAG